MLRILTCVFCLLAPATQAEVTVFAAASLRGVLEDINQTSPTDVTVSYASSAALARQISQGAPADVFLSANMRWVDWLKTQNVSEGFTSRIFLENDLVLIGATEQAELQIEELPRVLEDQFLAIGHDRAVPAGIYAREALMSLGLWAELSGKIIQTDNVRAALRLVALGEAPFAVTYATDARAEPRVKVLYEFDPKDHSPITYGLAQLTDRYEVDAYLSHLDSAGVAEIFKAHGFRTITE